MRWPEYGLWRLGYCAPELLFVNDAKVCLGLASICLFIPFSLAQLPVSSDSVSSCFQLENFHQLRILPELAANNVFSSGIWFFVVLQLIRMHWLSWWFGIRNYPVSVLFTGVEFVISSVSKYLFPFGYVQNALACNLCKSYLFAD